MRDMDTNHPCSRHATPNFPSPRASSHTPRDGVRPSQETPEPCCPLLPFLQHGHRLPPLPGFGMRLPLRDPSKTAQYLSPFEKIHIRRRGGLLRALTALPKSRDDRESLSMAQAQRMQEDGEVPSKPLPDLGVRASLWTSAHGRDPALGPWASRDSRQALGCSHSGRYI